ncbi:hypothetical protein SAMN04488028_107105 [Reichenbachiella agariperforans]|uniref:Tat (Twin-arginine translocation) pathway signal sequence n=1 Tax=Reichenbachiella agariperforans TaxID=156994 RepID=A0A1M6UG64_REIAG|nr:6-bladed beta-propeller [Reichenbachiella agariperforans]SHK68160.1 hypothetical protein SAMN04488028_107105 [Reichenbachiella agariperforans]
MNARRNFIKKGTLAAGALGTTQAFGANIIDSKKVAKERILGHGDYQYRLIEDWAQMWNSNLPILNCHEMVMDSKGRLIMLGDHKANNVIVFDKSGKVIDSWGCSFPGGHGLTLSKEGEEDFLFIADSGWQMNNDGSYRHHNGRVTKTTVDGKILFDIGHPATIGVYEPGETFSPTETAVAPNGDIYVADGYGKDIILQYDQNGRYIRHWGGHNNTDANYNLNNAHGVTLDTRDPQNPMLIISSRGDNSYKFFSLEGKYIKTLHLPNMWVCRAVIDEQNLYAGVCWSKDREGIFDWKQPTGFVTVLEGDQVVSCPGAEAPVYKKGILQPTYQLADRPIFHGHDVCVDEDKNLYICQWNALRTAPFKLERI